MDILNAVLLSLLAGLATGLGGLLVALFPKLDLRLYDSLIGFAAGVMTAIATMDWSRGAHQGSTRSALRFRGGRRCSLRIRPVVAEQHETLGSLFNPIAYRRGVLLSPP